MLLITRSLGTAHSHDHQVQRLVGNISERASKKIEKSCTTMSGWWFGCHFFILPLILGMSSSQLTNSYFSEGWPNHQPDYVIFGLCTLLYTYFYFFGCCYKYNLTWILYQCDSKSATEGLVMSWESPIGFDDFPWSSPGGFYGHVRWHPRVFGPKFDL